MPPRVVPLPTSSPSGHPQLWWRKRRANRPTSPGMPIRTTGSCTLMDHSGTSETEGLVRTATLVNSTPKTSSCWLRRFKPSPFVVVRCLRTGYHRTLPSHYRTKVLASNLLDYELTIICSIEDQLERARNLKYIFHRQQNGMSALRTTYTKVPIISYHTELNNNFWSYMVINIYCVIQ
jgi:hypothetical protein